MLAMRWAVRGVMVWGAGRFLWRVGSVSFDRLGMKGGDFFISVAFGCVWLHFSGF